MHISHTIIQYKDHSHSSDKIKIKSKVSLDTIYLKTTETNKCSIDIFTKETSLLNDTEILYLPKTKNIFGRISTRRNMINDL